MTKRVFVVMTACIAVAALGTWGVGPAAAGTDLDLAADIDCDTATGEWVVTYTLRSNGEGSDVSGDYVFVGDGSGEAGELVFSPTVVDRDAPSFATLRLPGSYLGTLDAEAVALQSGSFVISDDRSDELDGSCAATPVTTTTSTTTPSSTTSTTVPAPSGDGAVAARPTYTG